MYERRFALIKNLILTCMFNDKELVHALKHVLWIPALITQLMLNLNTLKFFIALYLTLLITSRDCEGVHQQILCVFSIYIVFKLFVLGGTYTITYSMSWRPYWSGEASVTVWCWCECWVRCKYAHANIITDSMVVLLK